MTAITQQNWAYATVLGTIGGSALSTDSAPTNLASVAAARRFVSPKATDTLSRTLTIYAVGGTTITIAVWAYEATTATWILVFAGATVTPSAPREFTGCPPNALLTLQVTANTGVPFIGAAIR